MRGIQISKYEIIGILAATFLVTLNGTYGDLPLATSLVMLLKTLPLALLSVIVLWLILRLLFKK
jgi:hypothetical protein